MSDRRLLRIIVEETVRSPSRQADATEVRRLYGGGFEVTFARLRASGYIADHALDGHIALTAAGLRAARESVAGFMAE